MIYSSYLSETLSSDLEALLSALPFYLIGGVVAWLLTYLGQAIACSLVKADGKAYGVYWNPLKNISLFSVIGVLSFAIFGVGWTKPSRFDPEEKGKSFFIAVAGPLFCFIVSWICLLLYVMAEVPFLGSLLMGIASAGICFSIMNILPLPGLCGGVALGAILPEKVSARWMGLFKYYPLILTLAVLIIARSEANTFVLTKMIKYMGFFVG